MDNKEGKKSLSILKIDLIILVEELDTGNWDQDLWSKIREMFENSVCPEKYVDFEKKFIEKYHNDNEVKCPKTDQTADEIDYGKKKQAIIDAINKTFV